MPKQNELSGMERPKIKAIEEAAEDYVAARDKRMALTVKEVACKSVLIQVMQKHAAELSVTPEGDRVYRYDEEIVILSGKQNVKVKAVHENEADED